VELAIRLFITLVQVALIAFLMWGAWLSFGELRRFRPAPSKAAARDEHEQIGFERVASLVLLALLCTTIAGLP
jgi:hypothetical protein